MEQGTFLSRWQGRGLGALAEDIAGRLSAREVALRGDHVLNPDVLPPKPWREASVMIPLLTREEGLTVLFTQRSLHLPDHAGQVSFPGGSIDAGDADAIAAALREAEEEIGLKPENVQVLGRLDHYITRSGFQVTPVVAMVTPQEFMPEPFEVAEIFEVPLAHILAPDVLVRQSALRGGVLRHYYAMDFEKFHIWGATAGMLKNLVEIIDV